ncbi:MAG TPA: hypothetical protein VE616_15080 [Candidatus Udaeobacter sp.]|jgi:hypothetical protein|nr:hypothetical protein [Candidatus Udaeobacter sp.]
MKFRLLIAATLFLVHCAANQRPAGLSDSKRTGNYNRDLTECEREAAAVGAGNKAQAFDNCMKAKGYGAKR